MENRSKLLWLLKSGTLIIITQMKAEKKVRYNIMHTIKFDLLRTLFALTSRYFYLYTLNKKK